MNTLIIYANYKETSFSAAIRDTLSDVFHQSGKEVAVRDLYEIKFNPVLSKKDLQQIDNDVFPVDIMEEQKFITRADLICFVYPIWWSGMPAILKGYIERVFSKGFAYKFNDGMPQPLLSDKKAMIFNTTDLNVAFQEKRFKDALNTITRDCILNFFGLDVIEHKYFANVSSVSVDVKKDYLQQVIEIAKKI